MPSYPFLPPCITTHTHHLILDLDETLIHFDPDRNTYHVRPHGEDFLRNLSALY
jgi:predicted HAD superfamily phosphohydrolase YqeG